MGSGQQWKWETVGFYENRLKNAVDWTKCAPTNYPQQTAHCHPSQLIGTVGFWGKSANAKICLGEKFEKTNNKPSFCLPLIDKPLFQLVFKAFGEELAIKTELLGFNCRLVPELHWYVGSYRKLEMIRNSRVKFSCGKSPWKSGKFDSFWSV